VALLSVNDGASGTRSAALVGDGPVRPVWRPRLSRTAARDERHFRSNSSSLALVAAMTDGAVLNPPRRLRKLRRLAVPRVEW
jgi:hypothetical protein